MTAVGTARGGITVLNAIGTGIGGAVGIDLPVVAWASWGSGRSWSNYMDIPGRIVEAVSRVTGVQEEYHVRVHSCIPPSRGLKSSSALVNSMIEAVLRLKGVNPDPITVARLGVEASRIAGITVTGAYDDSLASKMPGVFITNNYTLEVIATHRAPRARVVILVPGRENPITSVDPGAFKAYKDLYMRAYKLAVEGKWLEAIPLNSLATLRATGLEDLWAPLEEVLTLPSTWSAGVSGKGPALFAITSRTADVEDLWRRHGDLVITEIAGG